MRLPYLAINGQRCIAECLFACSCSLIVLKLEKGVDGLFDSFARLDSRISSVGQTAAKIGDHLQVQWLDSLHHNISGSFLTEPC